VIAAPEIYPEHEEILDDPARFKVLVKGRRWGGTILGDLWLTDGEIQPGELRLHVSPYLKQAKKNVFPYLQFLHRQVGGSRLNRSELQLELPNQAIIRICGADNPDSIPGEGCKRVWLDEYDLYKDQTIWERVLRPMLSDTLGDALFTSSPRGRKNMYDFYMRGKSVDPNDSDWSSWLFTTAQSRFVALEEVEAAKRDMDPLIYAQEYEASFDTGGNQCAWNFKHDKHVKDQKSKPRQDESWIGLDFNISPMVAEIGGHMTVDNKRIIHYYDEIVIPASANTDMMCKILKERYPGISLIYPDPTGKAGSTQSIRSDHDILHDHGFTIRAHPPGRPKQNERLSSWNRMLLDGEGEVHMTISPRCKRLIEDQDKAERLPDGGINKRKRDPHALDAASYAVEYQHPIQYRNVSVRRTA